MKRYFQLQRHATLFLILHVSSTAMVSLPAVACRPPWFVSGVLLIFQD